MLAWTEKLRSGARRFLRSNRGAIAPMFGLLVVPLTLALGVSVDLGRAVTSRNNLQDSLDATGLALSHMGYNATTPTATVQAAANQWIAANMHDANICGTVSNGACSNIKVTVTPSLQSVQIVATANVTTLFGGLAGISKVPISSTTTVQWGMNHIELTLVLDNTGSMADDSKLTSLVTAAKSLVTTLLASNTTSDPSAVQIAIVPFSNTVNVGTTYGPSAVGGASTNAAAWLDPTASAYAGTSSDIFAVNPYNGAAVNRFTLLANMGLNWGGCVETRPQFVNGVEKDYDVTDTVPSSAYPGSQIVPYFAPDEPDSGSYNGGYINNYLDDGMVPGVGNNSTSTWKQNQGNTSKYYAVSNGYSCNTYDIYGDCSKWKSASSYKNKPTSASVKASGLGTGYNTGPNFGCGTAPIQRLTNSASTLNNLLNQMVATGDTNVPLGMFWGWMTLSPNAPFSDGVAYGTQNVTKIMIILTDGANHSVTAYNNQDNSYYSGVGYQWQGLIQTDSGSTADPGSSMNDRETHICANMKAKGIVIYTVPVEVTDATAQNLLQTCASSPSNYINVTSSTQLLAAFTNIAGSIGHLRISQ